MTGDNCIGNEDTKQVDCNTDIPCPSMLFRNNYSIIFLIKGYQRQTQTGQHIRQQLQHIARFALDVNMLKKIKIKEKHGQQICEIRVKLTS